MRLLPSLASGLAWAVTVQAQNDTYWPWQTYRSSSSSPPSLNITKSGDPLSPGYLFFDQNGPYGHNYSLFIMTDDNELIWEGKLGDYTNFRVQTFRGQRVLTFFNGVTYSEPYGFGYGIVQILDESYQSIYNVSLVEGEGDFNAYTGVNETQLYSWIDMHESRITKDDTMLVTQYNVTQTDLSSIGGPVDGWVTDSLFYEIDIETNEIVFEWSALDHIDEIPLSDVAQFYPLDEYGQNETLPYGYFHINSVDKFEDGSYLVSSRYFCSIFKIAPNGTVEWRFQGEDGGDFELGEGISFRYQHDAQIRAETDNSLEVSLFNNDNAAVEYGINQTYGYFIDLNTETWTSTLKRKLFDPEDTIYSASQGNVQLLSDDHVIMGYGSTAKIKEYGTDDSVLMTAQFGVGDGNVFSYRAYRFPWVGRPTQPPSVFACTASSNETKVYMSWNGATEHEAWSIFAGNDTQALTFSGKEKKSGFETAGTVPKAVRYVRAEAHGQNISAGVSEIVEVEAQC